MISTDLQSLRENYSKGVLDKSSVNANPIVQFNEWLEDAINAEIKEPNAMILSTATLDGKPSSRTVLLKGLDDASLIFYTNFNSNKAKEIESNPKVSLLFLWKEIERQVRIEGHVTRMSHAESNKYFQKRPWKSRLGALASNQSSEIADRAILENTMNELIQKYPEGSEVPCPQDWGGYIVVPDHFEFWQGRRSRLHDRIAYKKQGVKDSYSIVRLSP